MSFLSGNIGIQGGPEQNWFNNQLGSGSGSFGYPSMFGGFQGSGTPTNNEPWALGNWQFGGFGGGMENAELENPSNQRVTQTTTVNPWGPQGTALQNLYNRSSQQLNRNLAQGPIDPSNVTMQSIARINYLSQQRPDLLNSAMRGTQAVTGGRFDMGTGGYRDVYGEAMGGNTLGEGMFGQLASGGLMDSNPHRQAALDDMLSSVNDSVRARMSSMGRYGSDAMGEALGRSLGGVSSQFMNQAYNDDQNRFMQAAIARENAGQGRLGLGLGALQGQQGALGQNAQMRLAGAQLAPQLNEARYADAMKQAGAGAAIDQIRQDQQNFGWDQLAQHRANIGPIPGSSGTSVTREPGASGWLRLLGGLGAGIGGLGSLLGGLF